MERAQWVVTAGLAVVFLIGFLTVSSGLRWGYLVLAVATGALAVVRYRAARH